MVSHAEPLACPNLPELQYIPEVVNPNTSAKYRPIVLLSHLLPEEYPFHAKYAPLYVKWFAMSTAAARVTVVAIVVVVAVVVVAVIEEDTVAVVVVQPHESHNPGHLNRICTPA